MGQSLQQLLLSQGQSCADGVANGPKETLQFLEEHSPFMRWLERLHLKSLYYQNQEYLLQALTHSSFAHEQKDWSYGHNERLEFLGDAVLDHELSHLLWQKFPDLKEGELSRFRSSLVNEETLAQWARALGLQEFILLGKGESQKEEVETAILADAFEALLGALSLHERQRPQEVISLWIELFDESCEGDEPRFFDRLRLDLFDPKTRLQELTLEHFKVTPQYSCQEKGEGFQCHVRLNEKILGEGHGPSKKKAEVAAARSALVHHSIEKIQEI